MNITAASLTQKLEEIYKPVHIEVADVSYQHKGHGGYREGVATHFNVTLVSEAFEGLSRVKRHQHVYGHLQEELAQQIHALSLTLSTPSEQQA